MYFAAQAFTTSIVSAIASSIVYENLKMFFINKNLQMMIDMQYVSSLYEKITNK